MVYSVTDALSRISNPRQKLEVMFKRGLHELAGIYLNELAETHIPVFFARKELDPDEVGPTAPAPHIGVRYMLGFLLPDTDLANCFFTSKDFVVTCEFALVAETLGWNITTRAIFVSKVIQRVAEFPYCSAAYWVVTGTKQVVADHLLQSQQAVGDEKLLSCLELWMLNFRLREGRIFELRTTSLTPPRPQGHENGTPCSPHLIKMELKPIIERLADLGESGRNITNTLKEVLQERVKSGSWQEVLAVGYALKERINTVASYIMPFIEKRRRGRVYNFAGTLFALRDIYTPKSEDLDTLKSGLITLLAQGQAGAFTSFVHDFRDHLNIPWLNAQVGIMEIVAAAYRQAKAEERLGIAAALALHFKLQPSHEEILDLVNQSLVLDIDVSLKWEDAIRSDKVWYPNH